MRIIAGLALCLMPVIVNKWTLETFLTEYVGQSLSRHFSILLCICSVYSIAAGIVLIKAKFRFSKKSLMIPFFFLPFILPHIYSLLMFGNLNHTIETVCAEMLNIAVFLPLVLLLPRIGISIIFSLQMVFCFIQMYYSYNYSMPPDESLLFILLETNLQQATGYASEYLSSSVMLSLIGFSFFVLFSFAGLTMKSKKTQMRPFIYLFLIILAPLLLLMLDKGFGAQVLRKNYYYGFYDYTRLQKQNSEMLDLSLDDIEEVSFSIKRPAKEVHFMIIGESADRDHMSVYGYQRKTTPLLEDMKDELFLFDDVIAPFVNSIPNMKALLTFENYDMRDGLPSKATMIHYLKKANYKTYWVSNKKPIGLFDTLATIMANNCDMTSFIRFEKNNCKNGHDEILLDPIKKILEEDTDKKYIFVHLMGQHVPFKMRYPESFNVFKDKVDGKTEKQSKTINQYHNATVYNDYIIKTIIEMARQTGHYSSLLYTSDHGQNVYDYGDFTGHSLNGGLEIPFILWLSDSYRQVRPNRTKLLNEYVNRKYMADDTVHTVFDILGAKFKSQDQSRSIFSPDFIDRKRMIRSYNYSMCADYDTRETKK